MRETWVMNASPLISLAKIGRLDLLRAAEREVLIPVAHYEHQSDTEAVAEDEAAYRSTTATVMKIPVRLVPVVRALWAKRRES